MLSFGVGRLMLQVRGGLVCHGIAMNARATLHTASCVMKGHSKWQNIAKGKAKEDHMRSMMMQELYRRSATAVKKGGGSFDPSKNKHLSNVLADWVAASLPKEKFMAHLKRLQTAPEALSYTVQFSGPANTLFIAEAEVESRSGFSRRVNKCLQKSPGFALVVRQLSPGEFRQQGVLIVESTKADGEKIGGLDEAEELAIELECEEVSELEPSEDAEADESTTVDGNNGGYVFICSPEDLPRVESKMRSNGYVVRITQVEKIPEMRVKLDEDDRGRVEKFLELLKATDEVREVYDNIEAPDE